MQTELLPESGAPISRNGRRGHHRKAASDTLAWATSAFFEELPSQAEKIPSELGAAVVNPGNTPASNGYSLATTTSRGYNLGGILPESILDFLQDVDEDEVLEADELDVDEDTDLDDTSFEARDKIPPVITQSGQAAAADGSTSLGAPCVTSANRAGPATLEADCARGTSLHDETKPVSRLRGSTGGAASGSKRCAGDSGSVDPASRHVRHPSDPLLSFSQGAAPLLPLPLDKPLSEFTGQTRANAFDPSQLDPKRAKRIIANRQSAHRSRMKKLQAIHALEERVAASKAASETLRQQVAAATAQRRQALGAAAEAQRQLRALQQELASESQWQEAIVTELMKLGLVEAAPPVGFSAGDLAAKQLCGPVLPESQPPPPPLSVALQRPPTSSGGSVPSPLTPLPLPAAPAPAATLGPFQYVHAPATGVPLPPGPSPAVCAPVSTCSPLLLSPLACSSRTGGMLLPLTGLQPPLAGCSGVKQSPSCRPSSGPGADLGPAGHGTLHGANGALPHTPMQNPLHPTVHPQQMIMMPTMPAGLLPQPVHTLGGHVVGPAATDAVPLTAAPALVDAAPVVSPALLLQHPHGHVHPQLHPPYHLQLPLPPSGPPINGAAAHMAFAPCTGSSPVALSGAPACAFFNPSTCLAGAAAAHPAGPSPVEPAATTAVGGGAKANGCLQGVVMGDSPAEIGVLIGDSPMALTGLEGMDSMVMTDLAAYLGAGLGDGGSVVEEAMQTASS